MATQSPSLSPGINLRSAGSARNRRWKWTGLGGLALRVLIPMLEVERAIFNGSARAPDLLKVQALNQSQPRTVCNGVVVYDPSPSWSPFPELEVECVGGLPSTTNCGVKHHDPRNNGVEFSTPTGVK